MKKDKLYTVTKGNKGIINNIYPDGGNLTIWDRIASKEYGASYGDEGATLDDYMNSKNWLGLSKKDNPFSKGNLANIGNALKEGLKDGLYGAATALGGAALDEGKELLLGSVDEAALAANNEGTAALANYSSNAKHLDNIQGPAAVANVQNAYKPGILNSSSAASKNEEMRRQRAIAESWANRSVENNVDNILGTQMADILSNYSSFGGHLNVKGKKNVGIPVFIKKPFALGGVLQSHGSDWSDGLIAVNAGGSHEENPNDGVQMGKDMNSVPNLVEEGETVYNDYVFSNRILADDATKQMFKLPKKRDITFADISKKLEKEVAERPNDPISQAGFKAQMQALEEQQERQKQEMEAERARTAFEALSPEEQTAVMQNAAQQEAMAQQAAQEQAIAEQQAMQQLSPEEAAIMQQQADGSQAMVGQEPSMMAEGGHLYAEGSKIRRGVYKALGFHTDKEFLDWARKHKLRGDDKWKMDEDALKNLAEDDEAWQVLISDPTFADAVKDNPALVHALANNYDFGAYTPNNTDNVTFKDISKGNWTAQDYEGWKDSQDPAWLEAVKKGLVKEGMKQEDIAKALKQTDNYKRGSKWLQDSEDNRLRYLRTILEDENSPEVAKNYARKYIDNNGWKQGVARDYNTIFGSNGKGVRETNPGTYWHTPVEAVRGAQTQNWVINGDGSVEEIIGEVPTDWKAAGNYSWATPENDMTYKYYRRPSRILHAMDGGDYLPDDQTTWVNVGDEVGRQVLDNGYTVIYHAPKAGVSDSGIATDKNTTVSPRHRDERLRYAGLFGPAVGLGMQALGIGRPDYGRLDAVANNTGNVALANYKPIGNYLTYKPLDIWYAQNAMNAQARATDRAISNSNTPSSMAALLANGYNSQIASGNLYRQALESNNAQRERVEAFNRGTNQFNADAFNRLSMFNAGEQNRGKQYDRHLQMEAARQRLAGDAAWNQGIYGNVSGLFKGISDLGRENAQFNWLADLAADDVFGTMGKSNTGKRWVVAKGDKLKKRGLTI